MCNSPKEKINNKHLGKDSSNVAVSDVLVLIRKTVSLKEH